MSNYSLDSLDFKSHFGFDVEEIQGIESIPGRKGETFQSWDDSDGIEPFVDADDIILKEKEIEVSMLLLAANTAAAQSCLSILEDALFTPGIRTLHTTFAGSFTGYVKDSVSCERLTKAIAGLVCFRVKFTFTLATP